MNKDQAFFNRFSYTLGNEDWDNEYDALQIVPEDNILCISASGDRPLNLLCKKPNEIVAIDLNSYQINLLKLKMAAIKNLSYKDYIEFVGLIPSRRRLEIFGKIESSLDAEEKTFWKGRQKILSDGIIFGGMYEKYIRVGGRIFRMFCGKKIDKLFTFDNVEDQFLFFKNCVNTLLWKVKSRIIFNPWGVKYILKDPGFYEYIRKDVSFTRHLIHCFEENIKNRLYRDNFYLSFIFRGYIEPHQYPPYLKEEFFETLKNNLFRIKIKEQNIINFLNTLENKSFSKYSLSDVYSYLNETDRETLLREMLRCSRLGTRICLRQFLSNHQLPQFFTQQLARESEKEKQFQKRERAMSAYQFCVGEIKTAF